MNKYLSFETIDNLVVAYFFQVPALSILQIAWADNEAFGWLSPAMGELRKERKVRRAFD